MIGKFATSVCKIKNFLVKTLYQINKNHGGANPWMLDNTFEYYRKMQDLSIESFQKNLTGDWKLIEFGGEFDNLQLALIESIRQIQQFWHDQYPCNILYTDPDTLCIKPLDVFGKFEEFRLFTENDPLEQLQYHNSGVKYYPSTIESKFWNQIQQEINTWDFSKYDTEQTIYAKLMWEQPNLHINRYQAQGLIVSQLGRIHWLDKHFDFNDLLPIELDRPILHFHGSRDPKARLEWMQNIYNHLTIP